MKNTLNFRTARSVHMYLKLQKNLLWKVIYIYKDFVQSSIGDDCPKIMDIH